jgi:hypothetical protein
VTVDPDYVALHDEDVGRLTSYHTTIHPDWPRQDFDSAADLTEETRKGGWAGTVMFGRWAERQRAKALQVSTYEAAIHSLLRRIGRPG